jgi:hypothetical protein
MVLINVLSDVQEDLSVRFQEHCCILRPDHRNRAEKEVTVRKVVAVELVSLDGVMGSPEEWAFSYSDDEMGEASASGMTASDALLLGRVTYEHLAAYWPD